MPPLVLIVDDEKDLLEILQMDIEGLGYEVLTAENGRQARDLVLEKKAHNIWIDAILSDINMPQMNGLEFLKEIREKGVNTPCIFFSAYGDTQKNQEARRLGALDFIEKPFQPDELLEMIQKATEVGQSLRNTDPKKKPKDN